MNYINLVLLKGFVGKPPVGRLLPSGDTVVNFSIATKIGEHTEWHALCCFNQLAKYVEKNIGSGDLIYCESEIKTRSFQTEEGKAKGQKPKVVRELIMREILLISKKFGMDKVGDVESKSNNYSSDDVSEETLTELSVDTVIVAKPMKLPKFV